MSCSQEIARAIFKGDVEYVRHYQGADLDDALALACAAKQENIVRTLIEMGAKPDAQCLSKPGTFDILSILIEHREKIKDADLNTPLMRLATAADYRVISLLVEAGANARAHDNFPIKKAARAGKILNVMELIRFGANIEMVDHHGIIALDHSWLRQTRREPPSDIWKMPPDAILKIFVRDKVAGELEGGKLF